jgi:hypothetical protein
MFGFVAAHACDQAAHVGHIGRGRAVHADFVHDLFERVDELALIGKHVQGGVDEAGVMIPDQSSVQISVIGDGLEDDDEGPCCR